VALQQYTAESGVKLAPRRAILSYRGKVLLISVVGLAAFWAAVIATLLPRH